MRRVLGISALALGVVGALLSAAAIGIGWWAAVKTVARLDRVAARLDHGMSEVDAQLTHVESRLNSVRTDLNAALTAADTLAVENPDLPRVQHQIELLLERLIPIYDRADALADSLRSATSGLRVAADLVDQFKDDPEATAGVRSAAAKIDRAAAALDDLQSRVEALKVAKAVHLTNQLVAFAREAIAGSQLLAEGLAATRREIAVARDRTAQWRDQIVSWIYIAAVANTVVWFWGGLGQLCLFGWGRWRFKARATPPPSFP